MRPRTRRRGRSAVSRWEYSPRPGSPSSFPPDVSAYQTRPRRSRLRHRAPLLVGERAGGAAREEQSDQEARYGEDGEGHEDALQAVEQRSGEMVKGGGGETGAQGRIEQGVGAHA